MPLKIILYSLLLLNLNFIFAGLKDQIKLHSDSVWFTKNDTVRLTRSINLSWDYRSINTDSAMHYSDLAIKLGESLDLSPKLSKAYNIRASIHNMIGNFDSSKYYYFKSIKYRDPKNFMGNASTYMNLSNLYANSGMYEAGAEYLNLAKQLLDSTISRYKIDNIKEAIKLQDKYRDEILKYYNIDKHKHDSVYKYYKPLNTYITSYFSIFTNQGDLKFNSKDYKSALKYYNKCISFVYFSPRDKEKVENNNYESLDFVIHAFYKKASSYFELNEIDSALYNYDIAEINSKKRGDHLTYGLCLSYKARIFGINGEYKRANFLFDKAHEEFLSLNYYKGLLDNISARVSYLINFYNESELIIFKNNLNKYYQLGKLKSDNINNIKKYKTYYLLFKRFNKLDSSLYYLEKLRLLEDSVRVSLNKNKVIEQQELLNLKDIENELEYKSKKLEKSEIEKENLNKILTVIIISSVLIFISLILIIRSNLKIKKLSKSIIDLSNKKEELFSILAHDIRSPLSLSTKALKLINEKDINEDRKKEYLDQITEAVYRVNSLVQSILDWIISEREQIFNKKDKFRIDLLLEEILLDYSTKLNDKKLDLELQLENLELESDILSTRVIINNIISNAIKFSNRNEKLIVKLDSRYLEIINTGQLLESKQESDIMNYGRTYSLEGTSGEKGTGLGITIIKNLSKLCNYDFKIENYLQDKVKTTIYFR